MTATAWTPSPGQRTYVAKLLAERIPLTEQSYWYHHLRQVDSNARLDEAIQKLLSLPVLGLANLPDLEEAHYALQDDEGTFKFYKVDRPQEGKWAGRTFVKVQASDDYYPLRGKLATDVLLQIAQDPRQAAVDYGMQIGKCFKCHRTLTVKASIDRGMGPDCASKVGW